MATSTQTRSDEVRIAFNGLVRAAAVATGGAAALVLVGWQFGLELLKRVAPTLVAMNPLTAVAFIFAAVALWLLATPRLAGRCSRLVTGLGIAVTAIGALRLVAYLGGPDVGLDQILFRSELSTGGPVVADGETFTNRMAPNTACLFLLFGVALMLAAGRAAWRWTAAKSVAVVVAFLGVLAVIGYVNNVASLYRPTPFIPIALHTAVAFVLLAGGLMVLRPTTATDMIDDCELLDDRDPYAHDITHATRFMERYLPLGFGVAMFAIGVIGIVSYASIREFAADTDINDHTRKVKTSIATFSAAIYEVDAAASGYLIAGDQPFLEPYDRHGSSLQTALADLSRLTRDNPTQQQRIDKLRSLIDRKLRFLHQAIALRDTEGLAAVEQLIDEGNGRRLTEEIRQVLTAMHEEEAQLLTSRQQASGRSAAVTTAVITTGSGLAIAMVGLSGWLVRRDINLRRQIETQLRSARDEAERANRTKSEFLANMSHEIRTPMTAIIGYADLLLDPTQTRSDRLNYVNTIRRNGEHLLTIVNDVLDLSRIEAGKPVVDRMPCAPCGILSDAASLMRVRASEKGLPFEVITEGPIPETIHSDPTRLRQILINLIGNAIKFTDAGWVRLIVKLEHDEPTGQPMLRFDVIDTGIGMTAEETARLFRPFGQADSSTTRRFGGTGLGLTICKRLAEMLDGHIEVDSSPGRGSTFTLRVATGPLDDVRMLCDCREAMMGLDNEPGQTAPVPTALHGRVLLVDDGIDNRQLLSVYLRQAGAEVTVAEDGQAACDKALAAMNDDKPFDLILMDMQMPVLDGYGATSRLRAKGCTAPIIAITAHAMAEDRNKCLNAGCTDYLSKPIRRDAMLQMLARYLAAPTAEPAPAAVPPPSPTAEENAADDEAVRPFIEAYLEALPGQIAELQDLLDRGNLDELAALTHNLKGTGGLYGFMPITDAAADAEHAIRNRDSADTIARQINHLIATLEQTRAHAPSRARE